MVLSAFSMLFLTRKYKSIFKKQKFYVRGQKKIESSVLSICLFFTSFLCIAIIQSSVLDYTPVILQNRFDVNESVSGLLTSMSMFFSIFSSLLFGFIVDRIKSYKYLYTFGIVMLIPGSFLMLNFGWPMIVVGAIFMGIGIASPAISACAVFELFHKNLYGISIGIGMAVFSLGQLLGARCSQLFFGDSFENVAFLSFALVMVGIIGVITSLLVKVKSK